MAKIIGIIILVISFFVLAFAPLSYDYYYVLTCAILYGVFVLLYLLIKKKKNYLDFDCLFFVAYFFVTLYYPAFMYPSDPYRYVFFQLPFKDSVMSYSSGLALLGISSYIMGALMASNKSKQTQQVETSIKKKINTTGIFFAALVLVVLFIATGGYMKLFNEYVGGGAEDIRDSGGISSYFFAFFPAFLFSGIIAEFYNLKIENPNKVKFSSISKIGILATTIVFLMFMLVGSRTIPIQLVLIIMGLYTILYKPFGLIKFSGLLVIGFLVLALVGFLRQVKNDNKEFYTEDAAMDLIINNRNSFLAIERADRFGFNYGESMLSPLLAPIPFAQSLVINLSDLDEDNMRSALLFTKDTFGYVGDWGLGTNVLADVYISFGIVGVVFLFSAFGYFVNRSMKRVENSTNYLILYGILISYAVYIARAEYFFFIRYFVWSFVIITISLKLQKVKRI